MNNTIYGNIIYEVTILYEISKEKTYEKSFPILERLGILDIQRQFHYYTDEIDKDKIKSEIDDCINKNFLIYKTSGGFYYNFKEIVSIEKIN